MMGKYYTVDEVAEMINMHPKTIRKFIREGKLKANKVGKQWRITGHDLSVFTEGNNAHISQNQQEADVVLSTEKSGESVEKIIVSTVVDINVVDMEEGMRISNMLMAVMNNKDPKYGRSTMNVQYIEKELKVRIMLWGSLPFTEIMLNSISTLTS